MVIAAPAAGHLGVEVDQIVRDRSPPGHDAFERCSFDDAVAQGQRPRRAGSNIDGVGAVVIFNFLRRPDLYDASGLVTTTI